MSLVDHAMPLPKFLRSLQPSAGHVDKIDICGDETGERDRVMSVPCLRPLGDNRRYLSL
jgi:hypothetical protein